MQSTLNTANHCEAELPDNWEMRIDPRTGLPYYLNHQDQYTTWDDPRVVSQPRGMINNFGPMLQAQKHQRPRQASVEPSSSSNRYFTAPAQQEDYYTQSLPRRVNHPQPQQAFRRPFMDDWLGNGFKQFNTDFFGPEWPFTAHTIQRQNPARAQSVQPTSSQPHDDPRQQFQQDSRGFPIPVRPEPQQHCQRDVPDSRYEGEHYIIPTQYKRGNQSAKSKTEGSGGEVRMKIPTAEQPEQKPQPQVRRMLDCFMYHAIIIYTVLSYTYM